MNTTPEKPGVGADIAATLAALSPQQQAVLLARMSAAGDGVQRYPASAAQRRLWFLTQWDQHADGYHVSQAWRLTGPLDVTALRAAVDHLVARHEPLRTTFELARDTVHQVVHPPTSVPFEVVDVSGAPAPDEAAVERAKEHRRRPFDLRTAPLIRVLLVRTAPDSHLLSVALHHLACDAWSIGVMYEDISAAYRQARSGQRPHLADLELRYAEVALWEHAMRDTAGPADFWRGELDGLAPLDLPLDHPRPAIGTGRGASVPLELDASLTDRLRRYAAGEGCTPFMVLMATLQVLLLRLTGQQDFAVGIPIAGRTNRATERLIGPFFNVLPMRADCRDELSLRELTARVRSRALGVFAHQETPFDRLVDIAGARREPNRHPLFQVTFALQNVPNDVLRLDGLQAQFVPVDSDTSKVDLAFVLAEGPDGITGVLEWATDLFDAATAAGIRRNWLDLIDAALSDPDRRISDLAMSGQVPPSGTPGIAGPRCLHELFEEWVLRAPDAVAVVGVGGEVVSYAELDASAVRLAVRLRGCGVGPGVMVGVLLDRGVQMVVALLAVLKAGGAYVPLDPSYPVDRLRFVVGDAGCAVVVSDGVAVASELAAVVVLVGAGAGAGGVVSGEDSGSGVAGSGLAGSGVVAGDAAYVIYTSGSTGRPKGVVVEHRNIVGLIETTQRSFGFTDADVWTVFHSFSFDFSVWEMWGALASGGRMVLVDRAVARSPDAFRDLLREQAVSVLNMTPQAFAGLSLVMSERDLPQSLRYVIFGGEALLPSHLERWARLFGLTGPWLINMYGITETTVHVTHHEVGSADTQRRVGSRIGGPLPGVVVSVVDRWGSPVPVGVAGELWVGGAGVARGYLGRPALTASRFVAGPGGGRWYRTGDRVRWSAEGCLEFLGRVDEQVKIRGFRIEPGEVEACLRSHELVRDAVVVASADASGTRRLVAYVVLRGQVGGAALRGFVAGLLPDHLVPAVVVVLDALPLTVNGKVDRRALPVPDWAQGSTSSFVAARDEVEVVLAEVWSQVLGVSGVGVHDNFFDLGGDSITAFRIAARAAARGLTMPPGRSLATLTTVADLAVHIRTGRSPGRPAARQLGVVGLNPVQAWWRELNLEAPHHWNQSVVLTVADPAWVSTLPAALHLLSRRQEAFHLTFDLAAGTVRRTERNEGIAFSSVDLRDRSAADAHEAVTAEIAHAQASLDPGAGPLCRAVHFALPDGTHELMLTIHHLVVDVVSWNILEEELAGLLDALSRGAAPPHAGEADGFLGWCAAMTRAAADGMFDDEVEYWQSALAPAVRDAADSRPPGGDATGLERDETVTVRVLDPATTALLSAGARASGTTLEAFLLAAVTRALAETDGTAGLLVDVEGHGRRVPGLEYDLTGVVGWCTVIHPVWLAVDDLAEPTTKTVARAAASLRDVPRAGAGYHALRHLRRDPRIQVLPGASVSLNFLGESGAAIPGLDFSDRPAGQVRGGANARPHRLAVSGWVTGGRLHLQLTHVAQLDDDRRVAQLADLMLTVLQAAAAGQREAARSETRLLQAAVGSGIQEAFPLAPLQEGILLHDLLQDDVQPYLVQAAWRVADVPLDVIAQAWAHLACRLTGPVG